MSDAQEQQADGEQAFAIHNIYVKDVSFESPRAPEVFRENPQPAIQLNLGVQHKVLQEGVYEVTLQVTVTAKTGDSTLFLVELQQAGVFTVSGFDEQSMGPMLGIFIPNILFPYAREAVSSLVTRGGFPPLLLEPVNFEALYAQQAAAQGNA